jgi:tetratricopeptide (TPR) repeat protein
MLASNTLLGAFLRLASALAFGLLVAASAARADELKDASQLLKAGQYPQALERVNKLLAEKPRDPQARFLKGLILTEQGNTREALEIFQKLTQDYPELPEPYNNLAVIYASQGQYDKARGSLEQSIRTHPSYATAYENLGDVYARLASQAYDKALQLDSSNAGAQNKLALVRDLVGVAPRASPPVAVAAANPAAAAVAKPSAAAPVEARPVAQKPAEVAKPEPKPAATPVAVAKPAMDKATEKPAASPESEVLAAVEAWAKAWSARDAEAYLAHYARDFKTPGGESREAWEKLRRERVTGPKTISVSISKQKVNVASGTRATITFHQDYESDRFNGSSTKTLEMVKADGRWLIRQEKVSN